MESSAGADFSLIDLRVAKVLSAPIATGTRAPSRVLTLDLGGLGTRTSVGQFALVDEDTLVGSLVIAAVNLGRRRIGRYDSDALTLGVAHPASPDGEAQARPIRPPSDAPPGERVF